MELDQQAITSLVMRVMEEIRRKEEKGVPGIGGAFAEVDDAVAAAVQAQEQLSTLSREKRGELVQSMREATLQNAALLAEMAVKESGMGRVADKIAKHRLVAMKTPGVEDLATEAMTGDHGLTTVEMAPWGVIGAITPVTNPVATILCNAIGMIAAGNAVVFAPHPRARLTSLRTVEILNQALVAAGGPSNLLTVIAQPSPEKAQILMKHRDINLLVVTGGPGVVNVALRSGKKVIGAGPGNPPAVVDETCEIQKAGRDLVLGAGFDNNLPCIAEKGIIVVDQVADALMAAMEQNGARRLTPAEADAVTRLVMADREGRDPLACTGRGEVLSRLSAHKDYIGLRTETILKAAGVPCSGDPRIAFMEVGREHPLVWIEQLMPIIPVVRVADAEEAIRFGVEVEQGNRHTAMMWSHDVERMTRLARLIRTSIFVKNGPCYAGIGLGGEGHTTFTIATPTGEGLTSARTFTRRRRCVLVDAFSIV